MSTVGSLFYPEPESWGFRGDPFLWRELSQAFAAVELPSSVPDFEGMLERAFKSAVGADVRTLDKIKIERFAHGGMSSGGISGDYWRERAMPLLLARYITARVAADKIGGAKPVDEFDQKTIDAIAYYVYGLIDPRGNVPFYIGKGKDNRVFQHARGALKDATDSDKISRIREIIGEGLAVEHLIIRHGIETEKEALEIESALIDFASKFLGGMSNIAGGHHADARGLMSVQEVRARYGAENLTAIGPDCVIININRSFSRGMSAAAIYEVTRGNWVIDSKKIKGIRTVLADYRGLIVEVFQAESWEQVPMDSGKLRWRFTGRVADGETRARYVGKVFQKGSRQNPIAYSV